MTTTNQLGKLPQVDSLHECMYSKIYDSASDALDEILGPDEEDGAGEGLVAELWLIAEQRDQARADVERLRATHQPRRGTDIEAWIKAERDKYAEGDPVWTGLDYLLDDYRDHADTGTPLGREVQGPTGGYTADPAA